MREAARRQEVELRIGELPAIEVNAAAVELCLSNLLSNAIKYSDPSKPRRLVEVRAEEKRDADGNLQEIVVKVADNGIGVPAAERGHLFERFFRAHESTQPNIDGTGLGLSIVRETVEALGGHTWAEFPVEGSLFAFSLPCRRTEDKHVVARRVSERTQGLQ